MRTYREIRRHSKHPIAVYLKETTGLNWHEIGEQSYDNPEEFIGQGFFTKFHYSQEDENRALIVTNTYGGHPQHADLAALVYLGTMNFGNPEIDNIARLTCINEPVRDVKNRINHMKEYGAIFDDVNQPILATFSLKMESYYHVEIAANDLIEAMEIMEKIDPFEDNRATFVETSRDFETIETRTIALPNARKLTAGETIDAIVKEINHDGQSFTDADVIENIQQILKGYEG